MIQSLPPMKYKRSHKERWGNQTALKNANPTCFARILAKIVKNTLHWNFTLLLLSTISAVQNRWVSTQHLKCFRIIYLSNVSAKCEFQYQMWALLKIFHICGMTDFLESIFLSIHKCTGSLFFPAYHCARFQDSQCFHFLRTHLEAILSFTVLQC